MTDTTTQTPDDEFAAAFSELSTPGTSSTPTAAAAAPATPSEVSPSAEEVAAGAERPAAAVPSGEAGNGSEATPAPSGSSSTEPPAAPAAAASEQDYAAQIAALNAKIAEMEKPAPTTAAETPAEPQPLYSADEQSVIDGYMKDWPDVAKGEALLRRAEYSQMMNYIWQQFGPRLAALEQTSQNTSSRTQYQDLVALVPDYDQVRDAALKWIDAQPEYLKNAYQQVANTGTPKDVADLIGRFKKETNYVGGANAGGAGTAAAAGGGTGGQGDVRGVAAAAAAAPAAQGAGLAPAAAAAAAALKPVKTARSEPVTAPDPNDFDAAFKEYSAA